MRIEAVLFDMDGLLFDTENLAVGASLNAAREQGFSIGQELTISLLGTNLELGTELLLRELPGLDPAGFWRDFDAHIWSHIEEKGLPIKPFAGELLAWLGERGYIIGLCSGSPRHMVEGYLRVAGFENCFSAVLAGDDDLSLRSKPAPDMYLRLAGMLKADPAGCLVLEDSPKGLQAGRAAGMRTVMIPDLAPYTEQLAPFVDQVYPDLSHVIGYLEGN